MSDEKFKTILSISVGGNGQVCIEFPRSEEPLFPRQLAMLFAAATDLFARVAVECHERPECEADQIMAQVRDYYLAELENVPRPSTFETTKESEGEP